MIEVSDDELLGDEPVIPGLIKAHGHIPTFNQKSDAPTIFIDAIQGAMISPQNIKLSFIEHFVVEGDESPVQGRYVLNLLLPAGQLRPIADVLTRLADEFDQARQGAEFRGE
ncbi:MAG: hypothetical protein V4579_06830 [Pseudomonadota bacterium]